MSQLIFLHFGGQIISILYHNYHGYLKREKLYDKFRGSICQNWTTIHDLKNKNQYSEARYRRKATAKAVNVLTVEAFLLKSGTR